MSSVTRDAQRKRSAKDKAQMFLNVWSYLSPNKELSPVGEYPFDSEIGRKHLFDWAFVDHKVAVEVEGNAWDVPGGGKHLQDRDLEKYNIAAFLGWRVFRFSPKMLTDDPMGCVEIVSMALARKVPQL